MTDSIARSICVEMWDNPEYLLLQCSRSDCDEWRERFLRECLGKGGPEVRRTAMMELLGTDEVPLPGYYSTEAEKGFVYVILAGGLVKIGKASDPKQRIRSINAMNPHPVEILNVFEVDDAFQSERMLQHYFLSHRVRNEWFLLTEGQQRRIRDAKTIEDIL